MYFQFLIEDMSSEILIRHVMNKIKMKYQDKEIYYDSRSFSGIGHLKNSGNLFERKGGNLLNNLRSYLRGFEKAACETMLLTDHVFCIAVKEMEAWLLGDENAIWSAYPNARRKYLKDYEQDGICDTWEVLANMLYPGGLTGLKKKKSVSQNVVGKAKCEWADKIGEMLDLDVNISPSFQHFLYELEKRIAAI